MNITFKLSDEQADILLAAFANNELQPNGFTSVAEVTSPTTRRVDWEASSPKGSLGKLRIAASYWVGYYPSARLADFFSEQFRRLVHVDYLQSHAVYESVGNGIAAFGVVDFPEPSGDVSALQWFDDAFVLVCTKKHELAQQTQASITQLAGQKYVAFSQGMRIRSKIDEMLHACGVTVDIVAEHDNVGKILDAVALKGGLSLLPAGLLPKSEMNDYANFVTAIPLAAGQPRMRYGIIYRSDSPLREDIKRILMLGSTDSSSPSFSDS